MAPADTSCSARGPEMLLKGIASTRLQTWDEEDYAWSFPRPGAAARAAAGGVLRGVKRSILPEPGWDPSDVLPA